MKGLRISALFLVGFGCLIVIVGAILHLVGGYPLVKAAVTASNLKLEMQSAMRTVFLLLGWTWLFIAIVALIAAFTKTRIQKALVLLCGLAILIQIPIWVQMMGWFIGNEMFLTGGLLIFCGGLLLPRGSAASV